MEVLKMSDAYLDLKARIPVVARTEKTSVDSDLLTQQRRRLGLTNLDVARELAVTERTWARWIGDGEIPTRSVREVARVLELDFYEHFDSPTPINGSRRAESVSSDDRLESIEAAVFELASQLERAVEEVRTRLDRIHTQLAHIEDRLGDEDGQESSPTVSH